MRRLLPLLLCAALAAGCAVTEPLPQEDEAASPAPQEAEETAIQVEPLEEVESGERQALPAGDIPPDDAGDTPEGTDADESADEPGSDPAGGDESGRASPDPDQEAAGNAGEDETPAGDADTVEAPGHAIHGRVELIVSGEKIGPESFENAVVWFEPAAGVAPPSPGEYRIRTERKRFMPDVLVVPVGSTVAFPNDDDILHNVFAVSPNATFDLGRYGLGESRSHTFDEPGLALIHCDVHHAMQAEVLVVDTPFYTPVGTDGRFTLEGIPPGPGTLNIWHPRAEVQTKTLTLPPAGEITATLELVKPRVARHANKAGEPYRAARRTYPPGDEGEETEAGAAAEAGDATQSPAGDTGDHADAGDNVLAGRVELLGDDAAPEPGPLTDVVVYYEPEAGAPRPEPGRYEIGTRNKTFRPDVLVVPVDSSVAFPNSDNILHNVFSVSPNAVFDLGRYGRDESRAHTFDEPGLALIHCDVHHHMQADVLVLDTPYYTRADGEGAFRLTGLPDGPGSLTIWHPRADGSVRRVTLPRNEQVAARLEITKPRVPRHLNKFGEPYRKRRDRDNE